MFETLNQRAWYALHCLPRNVRGNPPSYSSLERANQLPVGIFSKLFTLDQKSVLGSTLIKLSRALNVKDGWLGLNQGEPPKLTGYFLPLDPKTASGLLTIERSYLEEELSAMLAASSLDEVRVAIERFRTTLGIK